jgi:ribonucleoside-diphosphate reductase alpha chain
MAKIKSIKRKEAQATVVHLSNLCTEILEPTSSGKYVTLTREELLALTPEEVVQRNLNVIGLNQETYDVDAIEGGEVAVCNLGSINIGRGYLKNGKLDIAKLHKNVAIAVKYLDRVPDRNFYPIHEAKASNMRFRPIGLGLMGLQDLFFQLRLPIESDEAIALSAQVQEEIYYQALKTSMELAKVNGPHRDFEHTHAAKGILQFDMWGVTPSDTARWDALKADIIKHGLRNSLMIAIAPTVTIAAITGAEECIETQKSNLLKRETLSGEFVAVNKFLVEDLIKLGRWNTDTINQLKKSEGSLSSVPGLPAEMYALYKTVWEVSQKKVVEHAAARGAYIDQSQSLNLFLDLNKFAEDKRIAVLSSMYMYAWEKGLKTTYYLRSRSKTKIAQVTGDANSAAATAPEEPEICESCT